MKLPGGILIFSLLLAGTTVQGASDKEREAEQTRLDQACEVVRQKKLIPEKQKYIEECVEKGQRPDLESCQRFYADYGAQSGRRAPLYYDLPECVKAHEYRQSYRSGR